MGEPREFRSAQVGHGLTRDRRPLRPDEMTEIERAQTADTRGVTLPVAAYTIRPPAPALPYTAEDVALLQLAASRLRRREGLIAKELDELAERVACQSLGGDT